MRKKQFLALILTVVMVVAVMTGCQNSTPSTQVEETTQTTVSEEMTKVTSVPTDTVVMKSISAETSDTAVKESESPYENIVMPQNAADWQKSYAEYLKKEYSGDWFPKRLHLEDITHDGIPELFVYKWDYWLYPQTVITYTDKNKAIETCLDYGTSNNLGCSLLYDSETGGLLTKNTGHLVGDEGKLDYILYSITTEGYMNYKDNNGLNEGMYGKISIEADDKATLAKAIEENMNMEPFLREPINVDDIDLSEYLCSEE